MRRRLGILTTSKSFFGIIQHPASRAWSNMVTRFLRWILFTLVVSILPILASAIALELVHARPTVVGILGAGELLTICCALSATAIGDLVSTKLRHPNAKLIFAGLCGLVALLTIVGYTTISVAIFWEIPYNEKAVAYGSIFLFVVTGACSAVCIGLAHEK